MTVARLAHFNSLRPRPSHHRLRLLRLACCLGAASALLGLAAPAAAAPDPPAAGAIPRVPLGFSSLLVRLDGDDEIGIAGQDLRVRMLERLRERGFEAVGAENLVFGKDESYRAAFRLGGTVRVVECLRRSDELRCRVAVDWELLEVARDAVVYSVRTWGLVLDGDVKEKAKLPARLLLGALDSLSGREGFLAALAAGPATVGSDPSFPSATFARCASSSKKMPAGAEEALRATVLVRTERGHGSGFFLTADGLLLTAAHVLDGPTAKLRLRDGAEIDAVAVRVSPKADVALLRTSKPISGQRCLAPAASEPSVGAEVYAAGAPADAKLAFSLTRGIVSGAREIDGRKHLQTDAAVSGGNSGGPLLDGSGAAAAVVVSKLVGKTVEGVAFGVPISQALAAVGLAPGASTDPSLVSSTAELPRRPEVKRVDDQASPSPSLDPEGERRAEEERRQAEMRAEAERKREAAREEALRQERARQVEQREAEAARDRATPGYIKALFWGGGGLAIAGALTGVLSYKAYDEEQTTKSEFQSLRVYNIAGWTAFAVGGGAVVTSIALRPPLRPVNEARLGVGPSGVRLEGSF